MVGSAGQLIEELEAFPLFGSGGTGGSGGGNPGGPADGCRPESRLGEECPVGDGSAAAILQWTDAGHLGPHRPALLTARAGAVEDQIAGANEDLGSGAALVVGGEGVVSDRYAEGEQAAGLDLVGFGVEAEAADHLAKQGHAPVVHPLRNSATASSRRARSRTAGSMGRAAG